MSRSIVRQRNAMHKKTHSYGNRPKSLRTGFLLICTKDVIELCEKSQGLIAMYEVVKEQQTKIHRRKSESGPPSKTRDGTILGR